MSEKKLFLFLCLFMLVVTGSAYAAPGVEVSGDLTLSGTGSIIFPNGTIQTTASSPTWSQKIPGAARWLLVLDGAAALDNETGLVWAKQTDGILKIYSAANEYCTFISLGGRMGWRVPTIQELATLVDSNNGVPDFLPAGHPFTDTPTILADLYWSSTPNSALANWIVNFGQGTVNGAGTTIPLYVRCVRGGQ